jgi:S-formylglutathione hydrolase
MTSPTTTIHRFDVSDPRHGAVPCAAIVPGDAPGPLPACLFLYGGGGSHRSLLEIEPLLASWWSRGILPPLLVATPDVGPFSFYLDDDAHALGWESFVTERFVPYLRARWQLSATGQALGVVGISMGGYGALKIALSRSQEFGAVAAISPSLEPARTPHEVPLRNRYHYPPEVPAALLGPARDAALYERDHPATRAREHATMLRRDELAVYIDAAGRDALHAHDGAEYLHRTLWQLDIAHEYHLRRDADHVGPGLTERLREAFAWVAARIAPRAAVPLSEHELAWQAWLEQARTDVPPLPPLPPESVLFPQLLRAQLAEARRQAAEQDETMSRVYGLLPPLR